MVIQHPQERRREAQARSRVALEVLLFVYAIFASVVIVRTIMLLLGVTDRVWIGRVVFNSTAIVTDSLAKVPGFGTELIGPLTMVDLLLLAIVVLVPLGLMATSRRP